MQLIGGILASRHQEMLPSELAIRVDGVTRALWKVSESNLIRLEVDAAAELIEVIAVDESGEFPLTSLLVGFDPGSGRQRAAEASVVFSGGRIVLRVTPGRDPSSMEQATKLELKYSAVGSTSGAAAAR